MQRPSSCRLHWDAGDAVDCMDCAALAFWDGQVFRCPNCQAAFAPDGAPAEAVAALRPSRWVLDVPLVIPQHLVDAWARTEAFRLQLDRLLDPKLTRSKREELRRAAELLRRCGAVEQRVAANEGASIIPFESTRRVNEDLIYVDLGASSPRPNAGMLAHFSNAAGDE